jgi:hypothetical protein
MIHIFSMHSTAFFFVDFRPARSQMTTVLDPDPATASHLVGPTEPNFADWFKRLDATVMGR